MELGFDRDVVFRDRSCRLIVPETCAYRVTELNQDGLIAFAFVIADDLNVNFRRLLSRSKVNGHHGRQHKIGALCRCSGK